MTTFIFLAIFCLIILPISVALFVSIEWFEVLSHTLLPVITVSGIIIYYQYGFVTLLCVFLSLVASVVVILSKAVTEYDRKKAALKQKTLDSISKDY